MGNLPVSPYLKRRIRRRAVRDYQIGECQNSAYQFNEYSRVESWRSGCELYLQLPLVKPYVRFSRTRLSDHLLPEVFADCSCLTFWYSLLRSSRITLEFTASTAISSLHLFGNTMKVLPLPSPKALLSLRYHRYYGQIRLPCRPGKISSPYIYRLPS